MEPGIKGTLFLTVWQEVHDLLDAEGLTHESLELTLEPRDLPYLEDKPVGGFWYPIDTHDRLLRVLRARKGRGSNDYWVAGGRDAADAMQATGLYHQFKAEGDTDRVGQLLVTLSSAAYSFSEWRWRGSSKDGSVFTIEVSEAGALPDSCRYRAVGFIERASQLALGRDYRVVSQRLAPDRIVFTARAR